MAKDDDFKYFDIFCTYKRGLAFDNKYNKFQVRYVTFRFHHEPKK